MAQRLSQKRGIVKKSIFEKSVAAFKYHTVIAIKSTGRLAFVMDMLRVLCSVVTEVLYHVNEVWALMEYPV
jgi:hypothetical protein